MSSIETVLQEKRVFPPPAEFVKQANISGMDAYRKLAAEAERDFEGFWARQARETLIWPKPFTQVLDESKAPFFRWFHDGELNASYNCLDRHLKTQPDKTAIIFEADDGKVTRITYRELHREVCRFANALKGMGIKPADRVLVYMPMSIQVVVAMQACARIGATHSVVFGGFSAKSVQERIIDAGAVAVITADGQFRGGREIALKPVVDEALAMGGCEAIKNVVVYKRSGSPVPMTAGRDLWWDDVVKGQSETCEPDQRQRRASALHPLHLGLDRQAQRHPAFHRRLPPVGDAHDEVGVRPQAAGRLLVHGRRRLGHRAQLHRLRPAGASARPRSSSRACRPIRTPGGSGRSSRTTRSTCSTPRRPRSARSSRPAATCRRSTTFRACASSARSASRSIPKPGCGTTRPSAAAAARSSTPGGRPRPAAT